MLEYKVSFILSVQGSIFSKGSPLAFLFLHHNLSSPPPLAWILMENRSAAHHSFKDLVHRAPHLPPPLLQTLLKVCARMCACNNRPSIPSLSWSLLQTVCNNNFISDFGCYFIPSSSNPLFYIFRGSLWLIGQPKKHNESKMIAHGGAPQIDIKQLMKSINVLTILGAL